MPFYLQSLKAEQLKFQGFCDQCVLLQGNAQTARIRTIIKDSCRKKLRQDHLGAVHGEMLHIPLGSTIVKLYQCLD